MLGYQGGRTYMQLFKPHYILKWYAKAVWSLLFWQCNSFLFKFGYCYEVLLLEGTQKMVILSRKKERKQKKELTWRMYDLIWVPQPISESDWVCSAFTCVWRAISSWFSRDCRTAIADALFWCCDLRIKSSFLVRDVILVTI